MQNQLATGQHSITDRIMGVLTLKAPTYREIADDTTATGQAVTILVVVTLIVAVVDAMFGAAITAAFSQATGTAVPASPVRTFLGEIINGLIGWLVGSWVFAFVSTTFFGGKTNMWEMARVFGFTQVFRIIGVIPCLGIIGWILSIIGAVIGIREASEFDTTKAILTAIVGLIGVIIVVTVVGIIVALILAPFGM